MADINRVTLVGRLTRDCELRYTNNGLQINKFSIAVNRRKKQGDEWVDEVSFIDCTLFGKSGEAVARYMVKGKQVGVDGELRQGRWEQDGQARSKVEVIVNNIQLLGGRSDGAGGGEYNANAGGGSAPPPASGGAPAAGGAPPNTGAAPNPGGAPAAGGDASFDDDVPF